MMKMMMMMMFFLVGGMAYDDDEKPVMELMYTRDELREVAGYGEEKLSTVLVVGKLLCDSFSDRMNSHSHPIPGASVVVRCRANKKTSRVRGKTDEYGDFLIDLPSHLHAIPNMEKRCIVRIVRVPKKSPCHHPPSFKHYMIAAGIKLLSSSGNGNGIRTYSTAHGIHLPFTTTNKPIHSSWGRKMLQ